MKKILIFSISIIIAFSCFLFPVSSVNYSTFSDTLSNNSTVTTLLSLRDSFDKYKDFVVFRSSQNLYILACSKNFILNNKTLHSDESVLYVYDTSYSSNDSRYYKLNSTNVNVTLNHVVTSNFLDFSSKIENENNSLTFIVIVCIFALLAFLVFRRFK